ncbi:MAG TPA: hypothetical protein VF570_01210 [Pyrinomonadaceae bacterium]
MTDILPPHSGQNFGVPSGWCPQPLQVNFGGAVGVPHSGQNLALPTSTPHEEQFAAAAAAAAAFCRCAGAGARRVEPAPMSTPDT